MKVVIITQTYSCGRTKKWSNYLSNDPWALSRQFELERSVTIQQLRDQLRTNDKAADCVKKNISFGEIVLAGVEPNEQLATVEEGATLQSLLERPEVLQVIQAEELPSQTLVLKLYTNFLKPTLRELDVSPHLSRTAHELGFDPVQGAHTPGARCRDACGFYGRNAGFCSDCWKKKSPEDRIRWSLALLDQVSEYEQAYKELEERSMAKHRREEEEEMAREIANKKAKEDRKQESVDRKHRGLCYFLRYMTDGPPWNLYNDDSNQSHHNYEIWTCGVWNAHQHSNNHGCDWKKIHEEFVERLNSLVQVAVEKTEANNPFQATFLHRDFLASRGVAEDLSAPEALRSALQWDRPYQHVIGLDDSVPSFFEESYCLDIYEDEIPHVKSKLVEATNLMRAKCSQVYLFDFDGDKCQPTYPKGIVARTKIGNHLVFVFAERVET